MRLLPGVGKLTETGWPASVDQGFPEGKTVGLTVGLRLRCRFPRTTGWRSVCGYRRSSPMRLVYPKRMVAIGQKQSVDIGAQIVDNPLQQGDVSMPLTKPDCPAQCFHL